MIYLFSGCNYLKNLDLSNFNTSSINNMEYLFNNCNELTSIKLGNNFNTTLVYTMNNFYILKYL